MNTYIVRMIDGTSISIEASSFMSSGDGMVFYRNATQNDMFSPTYNTAWYRSADIHNVTLDESPEM